MDIKCDIPEGSWCRHKDGITLHAFDVICEILTISSNIRQRKITSNSCTDSFIFPSHNIYIQKVNIFIPYIFIILFNTKNPKS